jgi:Domain of unknown function (DUF1707)
MGQARFMNIRIGDAERGESIALLSQHFEAGRLTALEHEDRLGRARAAIIRSEIEVLFEDLPSPHPDMSAAEPPQISEDELRARRETKASEAWVVIGGVTALVGLPVTLVLGFILGWWWLFAPVGGLVILAAVLSEVTMKPKELQD